MLNWPFTVRVKSSQVARQWSVVCRVAETDMLAARNNLTLACAFFFSLAGHGAFRAIDSTPAQLDVRAMTFSASSDRCEIRGEGECDGFDPAGVGVLINLIERLLPETDSLLIELPFQLDQGLIAPGRYPPRLDGLAFCVEDQAQDRNLELQLSFSQVVGHELRARIEEVLSDWWCAAALGAFRDADQSPSDSSLVPPEVIVWEHDTMRFSVEKVRASESFVDALVGVVAWIDRNIMSVERLEIL